MPSSPLVDIKKTLRGRYGALFGSYVRGEHGPDSDLDVLVTVDDPPGLLGFNDLENEALAQQAQESILSEIADNYRRVQRARRYHETMSDTLGGVRSTETAAQIITEGFQGQAGIANPATVQSAAWDMAQRTGATRHMDWDDATALAAVYAQQRSYDRQNDWFGRALFGTAAGEGPQGLSGSIPGFLPIINQFAAQERQLLDQYRQVLRRFDHSLPTDTTDR